MKTLTISLIILTSLSGAAVTAQPTRDWGMNLSGITTTFNTKEKAIALTFDACGSTTTINDYDEKLINVLIEKNIPATLFISGRWIKHHHDLVQELAAYPLFEIENHGTDHKPLSCNGKSAYGIKGTTSPAEVKKEIGINAGQLKEITKRDTKFFRSGTAHCDREAIEIATALGIKIVNFSINGDGGATLKKAEIIKNLSGPKPGSIIIFHMNKPNGDTAEALIEIIPVLQKQGYKFVRLKDVIP